VRDAISPLGIADAKVLIVGNNSVRVQSKDLSPAQQAKVTAALAKYAGIPDAQVSVSNVGPTWGDKVSSKALTALLVFFLVIAAYLTFRFEWRMALAAIIAVVHDIIITVGVYAVTGFEVTPATVVAFLTILGFSLYDTVVVFDKVEENVAGIGATGRETYSGVVNRSMNQVLMRSLNTSFVAVLPVFSLLVVGAYVFGAVTIKDFSLALFIGLLTGAYSSIFVATPILAILKEREPRYAALRQKLAGRAATVAAPAYAGATAGGGAMAGVGRGVGGGGDGAVEAEQPVLGGSPRQAPRPVPTRRPSSAAPRPRQKRRKR
jgi:preprotein translocase subunit SecF